MRINYSSRGFELVAHPVYQGVDAAQPEEGVVMMSSAIGEYEDSFDRPGSSFLWVGMRHHLNREEVAQLVSHLKAWLETGSLEVSGAR